MTKMGYPYRGKYPLMQRDGWHWQVPEWRQGLPDTAAQEVTVWWCSIPPPLAPATRALLPYGLHKLPSSGGAGIPGVSFPALDLYGCGGIAPNGTWTAAAGLALFITAASGNAQRLSGAMATHLAMISLGIAESSYFFLKLRVERVHGTKELQKHWDK